jgi:hypothetical protein
VDPITPEYARMRAAIIERLNANDLLAVMDHGAPETEYDPEMEDFAVLITAGTPLTLEVVATVWHKWFGDSQQEGLTIGAKVEAIPAGTANQLLVTQTIGADFPFDEPVAVFA